MTAASTIRALARAVRPRQWIKNLLVFAAPLAAGVLDDADILLRVTFAGALMVLASSAIYLTNDILDADADRAHPTKSHRAIASGALSGTTAGIAAAVLAVGSLAGSTLISTDLMIVIGIYLLLQGAYVLGLKHQPVLDLAVVSAGFLLRAIAGGVAADVPLSQWFLMVAAFGSLYMVAGKRYSELRALGPQSVTRRALALYSESFLRFVWGTAAAVTITAYCLWAFEMSPDTQMGWQTLSVAPFVLAMLRYGADIDRGAAGEPEDVVLRDPVLLTLAIVWIASFVVGRA